MNRQPLIRLVDHIFFLERPIRRKLRPPQTDPREQRRKGAHQHAGKAPISFGRSTVAGMCRIQKANPPVHDLSPSQEEYRRRKPEGNRPPRQLGRQVVPPERAAKGMMRQPPGEERAPAAHERQQHDISAQEYHHRGARRQQRRDVVPRPHPQEQNGKQKKTRHPGL